MSVTTLDPAVAAAPAGRDRRWLALAVIVVAQLMIILDASISGRGTVTEGPDQPGMIAGTQMSKILSIVGTWKLVTGGLPLANGIIGLGGELAWPKPTRPGDTLRVESEVLEILPSRSKPNQGIVKVRSTTLNQDGEAVHIFTSKVLVFKRPAPI